MNKHERKGYNGMLSKEQELLLIQTRLAVETDFRDYNGHSRKLSELWKKIQQQLIEKDSSMQNFTLPMLRASYRNAVSKFKTKKANSYYKSTLDLEVLEMFEQVYRAHSFLFVNNKKSTPKDVIQLLLNARLSRESEFAKLLKNENSKRKLLWQQVLSDIREKTSVEVTTNKIKSTFIAMFRTYKKLQSHGNRHNWPYFNQFDQVFGHNNKSETGECADDNDQIRQLILNARLSREAEFAKLKNDNFKRKLLWQQIHSEVFKKASVEVTTRKIQRIFANMFNRYKKIKSRGNRSDWPYFNQFDQIFRHDKKSINRVNANNEIKQLVLNARLSRETEFQKYGKNDQLLWHEIEREVKEKAISCTTELTAQKTKQIFQRLFTTYKTRKCHASNDGSWPYFKQLDKVYGKRVPFETFTLQLDKVYVKRVPYETFIMQSDDGNIDCHDDSTSIRKQTIPTTAKLLKFLAKEAKTDRKMLQQICNIEKKKLNLEIKEIAELRELRILLHNKI